MNHDVATGSVRLSSSLDLPPMIRHVLNGTGPQLPCAPWDHATVALCSMESADVAMSSNRQWIPSGGGGSGTTISRSPLELWGGGGTLGLW
jgi:hypothetical protein